MCGAARLLRQQGHHVSGSDIGDTGHLDLLVQEGVTLYKTHEAAHMADDVDEVVYTVAVPEDNPEIQEARRRCLPLKKYAQIVGEIMAQKKGVCVAGTHGKTTTSSMLAWTLRECGRDPSFIIGAHVPQLRATSYGGGEDFVLESCEFDRSFHNYRPQLAIITNIDEDHLDYYRDIHEIQESFRYFCSLVAEGGLFMNGDDAFSVPLINQRVSTFGFDKNNKYVLVDSSVFEADVFHEGEVMLELKLKIPGKHNLLNATAAALVALHLGCERGQIERALSQFEGAERRFQVLYQQKNFLVVDDYAHHPKEIKATLMAAKEVYPDHKKIVIFQPHQRSRTKFLLDDFALVLSEADISVLPDIYSVRDHGEIDVTSLDLVKAIRAHGAQAHFIPDMNEIPEYIKPLITGPTLVFVMGAGDISKLGTKICRNSILYASLASS